MSAHTLAAPHTAARTHTAAPKGTSAPLPSGATPVGAPLAFRARTSFHGARGESTRRWFGTPMPADGEHSDTCNRAIGRLPALSTKQQRHLPTVMFIRSSDTRRQVAAGTPSVNDARMACD
jgi:hypothetical protein